MKRQNEKRWHEEDQQRRRRVAISIEPGCAESVHHTLATYKDVLQGEFGPPRTRNTAKLKLWSRRHELRIVILLHHTANKHDDDELIVSGSASRQISHACVQRTSSMPHAQQQAARNPQHRIKDTRLEALGLFSQSKLWDRRPLQATRKKLSHIKDPSIRGHLDRWRGQHITCISNTIFKESRIHRRTTDTRAELCKKRGPTIYFLARQRRIRGTRHFSRYFAFMTPKSFKKRSVHNSPMIASIARRPFLSSLSWSLEKATGLSG